MKKYILAFVFTLFANCAFAQGSGQLPAGTVWGNPSASKKPATSSLIGPLLDQGYTCTAQGSLMMRGASLWVCLAPGGTAGQPLLSGGAGANLTYGQLGLGALASGTQDTIVGYFGSTTASALAINNCSNALTYSTSTHTFGCNGTAGTGTVTQLTAGSTALTVSPSPLTTSGTVDLSSGRKTNPTTSAVTTSAHSGGFGANTSGTYTTPANVLWIEGWITGGGGGGGAGNNASTATAGNNSCWNTTGAACTTPVYQAGGGGAGAGGVTNATAGGAGGTLAGSNNCDIPMIGNGGEGGQVNTASVNSSGGRGGNSFLGGAARATSSGTGATATANSGSGGAGGAQGATIAQSGGGGGSGATCYFRINAPAGTYTYVVGTGGAGNASPGTGGGSGGAGADGSMTIIEHYGS